ncbi:hypothetical protein HDU67_010228 [Dinochytrium kinnereticum]|nr:hypothetical protein HDU67_010228 [Dinochytrium kinnereticum]
MEEWLHRLGNLEQNLNKQPKLLEDFLEGDRQEIDNLLNLLCSDDPHIAFLASQVLFKLCVCPNPNSRAFLSKEIPQPSCRINVSYFLGQFVSENLMFSANRKPSVSLTHACLLIHRILKTSRDVIHEASWHNVTEFSIERNTRESDSESSDGDMVIDDDVAIEVAMNSLAVVRALILGLARVNTGILIGVQIPSWNSKDLDHLEFAWMDSIYEVAKSGYPTQGPIFRMSDTEIVGILSMLHGIVKFYWDWKQSGAEELMSEGEYCGILSDIFCNMEKISNKLKTLIPALYGLIELNHLTVTRKAFHILQDLLPLMSGDEIIVMVSGVYPFLYRVTLYKELSLWWMEITSATYCEFWSNRGFTTDANDTKWLLGSHEPHLASASKAPDFFDREIFRGLVHVVMEVCVRIVDDDDDDAIIELSKIDECIAGSETKFLEFFLSYLKWSCEGESPRKFIQDGSRWLIKKVEERRISDYESETDEECIIEDSVEEVLSQITSMLKELKDKIEGLRRRQLFPFKPDALVRRMDMLIAIVQ